MADEDKAVKLPASPAEPPAPPVAGISGYHRAALAVALLAGGLAWYVSSLAMRRAPSVFGNEGASLYSKGQLSGIGGIIGGILVVPQIRDPKIVFVLASAGLLLGTVFPWLYQILPSAGNDPLWASARDVVGPALFGFGVALLVKSADAKTGASAS